MKALLTLCLTLCASLLLGQGLITEAEYFIDNDPGSGAATAIAVLSGASLGTTVQVPAGGLEPGIHVLAMRTKSDDGRWSVPSRKNFFVLELGTTPPIIAAEYFFDGDPGMGNGTSLAIDPGLGVAGSATIEVPPLASGLHTLSIRMMNEAGEWSLYARKNFFLTKTTPSPGIAAAEYFIGEDPGLGNGSPLSIIPGAGIALEVAIDLPDDLPKGLHSLQIRVKDNNGRWSLYARHLFFNTGLGDLLDLVQAEFFIDEDPGTGEATPLSISPSPGLDQVLDIPLPQGLSVGDHMLYIRVLREDGKWSLLAASPFSIDFSAGVAAWAAALGLYPNPTRDVVRITGLQKPLSQYHVLDMQGKLVAQGGNVGDAIDLSSLSDGVYLLQLHFEDGTAWTKKVVRQ